MPGDSLHVVVAADVAAPADSLWAEVADFGSVDRLLPSVVECRLEGEGIGARRHLTTPDGGRVVSELTELDAHARVMAYAIVESDLPMDDYRSRVSIEPTPTGCRVRWESWCTPHEGVDADVRELLDTQLRAGVARLAELHRASPTWS